jgi:hypothetical protein
MYIGCIGHTNWFVCAGMDAWNSRCTHMGARSKCGPNEWTKLGRYGDTVKFSSLPRVLQNADGLAKDLGARAVGGGISDGRLVCGSEGEVASDPRHGQAMRFLSLPRLTGDASAMKRARDYGILLPQAVGAKAAAWLNIALFGPDQLRSRLAWALSQIYVVGPHLGVEAFNNEPWLAFYDILVRNGLGNLKQLLNEVAHSPQMGTYLTFMGSRGIEWSRSEPDENFAREFMELFTIGLVELNSDGTPVQDANNLEIESYSNADITEFARVWTGFKRAGAHTRQRQN